MSLMSKTAHSLTPDHAFEVSAPKAVLRVRNALASILDGLPDEVQRATDLQRLLELDTTLSWQVFTFATAANPASVLSRLPGAEAMNRFLQAARNRGVARKAIDAATRALEELDAMVQAHAGDRKAFDAMVSGLAGEDADPIDLPTRRTTFRGNSRIWGAQAKTQLVCLIAQLNERDPLTLDAAGLKGFIGMRRNRRDAALVIASTRVADEAGRELKPAAHEPISPIRGEGGDAHEELSLIPEFCTQPMPNLRRIKTKSGGMNYEVAGDDVGKKSAVTCIAGHVWRQVGSRYATPSDPHLISQTQVRMPAEVLIHDVLVHQDVLESRPPKVLVYGDQRDVDIMAPRSDSELLPLRVSVERLGRGLQAAHTPDVPRYPEMIGYAMDRLGWEDEKFDVWRCRVEYPVMPSIVKLQFDLPEKP